MQKVLTIMVFAVLLASARCVAQSGTSHSSGSVRIEINRNTGRQVAQSSASGSSGNRPHAIVLTNGPPEFRQYDEAFLYKVQMRWYELLDSLPWTGSWTGKVVVSFHLHDDGRITDVLVVENTTTAELGELCQKALVGAQPYGVWPQSMRQMVEKGLRMIRVSFYFD